MDDSMDSVPDVKMCTTRNVRQKCLSSEPEVLQCIPSSDCATEVDLDHGELPPVKTLGVVWCPTEDELKFHVNQLPEKNKHTQRGFLKTIAALCDPLGLLSPYTLRAKVLLQEMWACGVDWDKHVNKNLSFKASRLCQEPSILVKRKTETKLQ